jgi:hypothetical protein
MSVSLSKYQVTNRRQLRATYTSFEEAAKTADRAQAFWGREDNFEVVFWQASCQVVGPGVWAIRVLKNERPWGWLKCPHRESVLERGLDSYVSEKDALALRARFPDDVAFNDSLRDNEPTAEVPLSFGWDRAPNAATLFDRSKGER